MTVDADFSQARAYATHLRTAGPRVGATGAQLLRETAHRIENDAKTSAPVADVAGGTLRDSIAVTFLGDGRNGTMTAEVAPAADYGIYQEYGTSVMAAQPFMGPAFDSRAPGYAAALGQLGADEAS